MASIKDLKHDINVLTYDLLLECFTYKKYQPDKGGTADKVISEIIKLRNDLINRVNNPENEKGSKELRLHFKKIREDLGRLVKMVERLGKDD